MKKIYTLLFVILAFMSTHASATLIDLQTNDVMHSNGDLIEVSVFIDNTSGAIAELEFDIDFDPTLVTFNSFTFDIGNTLTALAIEADVFVPSALSVYALWFESIELPAERFELGVASFQAIADSFAIFDTNNIFVGDDFGNEIAIVPVSAPATIILFASYLLVILARRNRGNYLN